MKQDAVQELAQYKKYYQEFIDLAAHDLDAPLRKLSTLVERMLAKIKAGEPVDAQAFRVQHCVAEMRGLLDALNQLSTTSSMGMMPGHCDVGEVLNKTVESYNSVTGTVPISLQLESSVQIAMPAAALDTILSELLSNAIKFKKVDTESKIEVKGAIAVADEVPGIEVTSLNKYYRVEISDNGIGFAGSDSQRIFDAFIRLHGKSEYAGYGMGLSICKRVAENYNAIIYARPNEAGGAQFVLFLPQTLP